MKTFLRAWADLFIRIVESKYYWLIPVLFWLFLSGFSVFWNLSLLNQTVVDIAYERGHAMYQMIRQTKINPYIMKSDPNAFKQQSMKDLYYRVVSNQPINPNNRASAWETKVLDRFETDSTHYFSAHDQEFRYVGPLYTKQICLSCHGFGNAEVGDVRGGISITVSAQPIIDSQTNARQTMLIMHATVFLIITSLSILFMQFLRRHWRYMDKTQRKLRDQKQFLSDVTNSMSEGFVVLDGQGRVTYANPECVNLLGWDDHELVGEIFVNRVYRSSASTPFKSSECAINQTLDDALVHKKLDDQFLDKQGEVKEVSLSVSPLIEGGESKGAVVMFGDIAERKQAEQEQARLERELNQTHKMEAIGQLAGGIAHEINTPIQYVGDNLRFLKEAFEDFFHLIESYEEFFQYASELEALASEAKTVSKAINELDLVYLLEETPTAIDQSIGGVDQVAGIVQAMKEFAHPGSSKKEPSDINRIVNNALAVCRNEWKYVAEAELHLEKGLPNIRCRAGDISQVVLNLIVNAAYAIEAKGEGGKGTIVIKTKLRDKQIEFSVSDTGTGIPEEARDYIFNPFFTTKDVGRGTGQGLAIVHDIIVSKHQGEIFFDTELGVGSTFFVRLPLEK
jgi:PAS domain S-box-containing protein